MVERRRLVNDRYGPPFFFCGKGGCWNRIEAAVTALMVEIKAGCTGEV